MKLLILFFIFLTCPAFSWVILIDPGHGGTDLGATKKVKKTIYEKDLALKLADKVKRRLSRNYTTFLTRSFDRKVTLEQRAQMAEKVKADLFISIHFNSSKDSKSRGFETFYLDNHNDSAIKKMELIENTHEHKGEDKIISQILIDLVIQKTVPTSKALAKSIHNSIASKTAKKYKLRDRGIRPGLFYVLALSKRPGVLIEAGFMSNKKELSLIQKESYLNSYADDITKGIIKYLKKRKSSNQSIF